MFDFLKKLLGKRDAAEAVTREEYSGPLRLRVMGRGSAINYEHGGYYSSQCLWWVSEETDADGQPVYIRESREHTVSLPAVMPFQAGGKLYRSLRELSPEDVIDGIDTDVHGRKVLCYRERFPCFDSYDYLHEHRFYRWFFLKEKGKLIRVYTADESGWIYVTEDTENVENECIELLRQFDWIE